MTSQIAATWQPAAATKGITHRRTAAMQRPAGMRLTHRPLQQTSRPGQLLLARAEPAPFNEGAAQVRRLVDRDRKELDLDDLEAAFGADPAAAATPSSAADADSSGEAATSFMVNSSQADKRPVSPFGPSSSKGSGSGSSNPFGSSSAPIKRPFAEPAGLSPNMPTPKQDEAPWWTKVTLTQIVIVASFTTIISLMIGTFFFVLSTGAIHFNE